MLDIGALSSELIAGSVGEAMDRTIHHNVGDLLDNGTRPEILRGSGLWLPRQPRAGGRPPMAPAGLLALLLGVNDAGPPRLRRVVALCRCPKWPFLAVSRGYLFKVLSNCCTLQRIPVGLRVRGAR